MERAKTGGLRSFLSLLCVALLVAPGGLALPQGQQAPPPPDMPPADASQSPTATADSQALSMSQLENLVAPIALYPDPLLGQVLAASTYPLELVEAEQWVKANPSLRGTQVTDAAEQQNWDPSVQAMVAFPELLDRLTSNIRWTTDLGNAFLSQQSDLMEAVQRMRARAEANGRLSSDAQETVTTATQNGQSAIEIMPADPQVMYVPYYDPAYIWGPPVWGYYPALWYPPFGFGFWPGINIGFYFGGWGGWGFGWGGWGWGPAWFGRGVFVNYGFFNRFGFHGVWGGFRGGFNGGLGRTVWAHDATHRLGVAYPTRALTNHFGTTSMAPRAAMTRSGFAASGVRNSFAGSASGSRSSGGGMRDSFGQTRGGYRGSVAPGQRSQGFRGSAGQGGFQGYRGGAPQGFSRGYQSPGGMRSYQPSQSSRGAAPGGGGFSGFSGARSAPRGTGGFGGGAPSSGGGGGHSFGGGGEQSFGGGHAGGGGGQSFGAGHPGGGGGQSFGAGHAGGGGGQNFGAGHAGGGGGQSFGAGHAGGGGGQSFGAGHAGGGGGQSFGAGHAGGGGGQSFGAGHAGGGGGQSFGAGHAGGGGHAAGGGHGGRR